MNATPIKASLNQRRPLQIQLARFERVQGRCACCTSQLSALPPNTLDSLIAISGEIPRFSFTSFVRRSDQIVDTAILPKKREVPIVDSHARWNETLRSSNSLPE